MIKLNSQTRSTNYIEQVKKSFLLKTLTVICSFIVIPLMVGFLGSEKYGVWSTLLSVLTWITFFDLGIGNGLRNKLAECIADGKTEVARTFISSAYSLFGLISILLIGLFFILSFGIPWQKVLNTSLVSSQELSITIFITSISITINFWLGLINSILNASHKTSVVLTAQFLFSILFLFFILILTKYINSSVLNLALIYCLTQVSINIGLNLWFLKKTKI